MRSPVAPLIEQTDATALPAGTGACLGAFDGLHRGHRALIVAARAGGGPVALVTFEPHPMQVLAPERAPALLLSPAVRRRVAAALGVTHLVLLPFDAEMAARTADEFIDAYLIGGLRPATVVVGRDFRFGHDREGTAEHLAARLDRANIATRIVDPVAGPDLDKLGATAIRVAVSEGRVRDAADMLGRWHAVSGRVVTGHRRGRTLGFPTANVAVDGGMLPPDGVYATFLAIWSGPERGRVLPSVANLGTNPTFAADTPGGPVRTLEVHAIDVDLGERLYGLDVEVAFVARLRGEQRFDGPSALVAQIRRDIEAARPELGGDARKAVVEP